MNNNEKVKFFSDMEAFAQKVAQSEDSGEQLNLPLKDPQVININDYERYWDNSTPNGHQIRILKQDGSTLTINMEWPKGKNPRTGVYTNRE